MYCLLLISDCVCMVHYFFLSFRSFFNFNFGLFFCFFFHRRDELCRNPLNYWMRFIPQFYFFSFSIELILLPLLPFAKSLFHAYLTLVSTHQPPVYPKSFHATLSISAWNLNLTQQSIIIIIIKYIYFLLIEMGNLFFYFWSFLKSVDFMCIFKG